MKSHRSLAASIDKFPMASCNLQGYYGGGMRFIALQKSTTATERISSLVRFDDTCGVDNLVESIFSFSTDAAACGRPHCDD